MPVLLLLICSSFSYLDINFLLDIWIANIFSRSELALSFPTGLLMNRRLLCFCCCFLNEVKFNNIILYAFFVFYLENPCQNLPTFSSASVTVLPITVYLQSQNSFCGCSETRGKILVFHLAIQLAVFIKWPFSPCCTAMLPLAGIRLIIRVSLFLASFFGNSGHPRAQTTLY